MTGKLSKRSQMSRHLARHPRLSRQRRGAYAVEFAFVAPVLFAFILGSVEFGRVNMLMHSLDNAVLEGARRGLVVGATSSDVSAKVNALLTACTVRSFTTSSTLNDDNVSVTVSVDMNSNSWTTPFFFKNKTLTRSITLTRR
jgi:Flp pilus assembly protein TadG